MTCELCGGALWRDVDDGYGLRMVPELTVEEAATLDGPATAAVEKERDRLRAAYQRTVFPCRCNTSMYDRWIDGHFEPGHRHEGCSVCQAVDESTGLWRRSRRSAAVVSSGSTPEISDPDSYQTHADF